MFRPTRAMILILLAGTPLAGQEIPPDTLAMVVGRPIEALVAELPGEPVALETLVAVAMQRNLSLEVARATRTLAEADLQTEKGTFDPSLTLGWLREGNQLTGDRTGGYRAQVSQALRWGTELGLGLETGRQAGTTPEGRFGSDLFLSLRQPLLEGLGTLDTQVRAAEALERAAESDLQRAREGLLAGVEFAYWTLAEAEAFQAVRQRSLEIAEALLFRNQELAERALVPEVDVITARSAVALRRAGLISARRNRLDAAEEITFLVWGEQAADRLSGTPSPMKVVQTSVAPPGEADLDPEAMETKALEARQDVQAARAVLRSAEDYQRAARRGVLPSLNLDGSLYSVGTGSSYSGSMETLGGRPSWSLGITLSHPLLNRRDRGVAWSRDLAVDLRRLEVQLVENTVRMEVRSSIRALEAGAERLAAAEEAASLARAQLEAERRRLDLGLGDSFRLLETEENAVQAELEWVRARFDLARAATRFRLAVGS